MVEEIMLATKLGKVCRFNERKFVRWAVTLSGVIGIDLAAMMKAEIMK